MDYNFTIEILDIAQLDIDNIVSYYAIEIQKPNLADRFLNNLEYKYADIRKYPFMYQYDPNAKLARQGIRHIPIDGYVIYYKVFADKQRIEIGRVLSDKQDNRNIKF